MKNESNSHYLDAAALKSEFDEYVYRVSHVLSSPIRSMVELSKLVAQDKAIDNLSEDTKEYLAYIIQSGEKAQAMMDGLLQYSHIANNPSSAVLVDVEALIKKISIELSERIKATGTVYTAEKLPQLYTDYEQLKLIFLALIDNAIKFQATDNTPHISIQAEKIDAFWKFSVGDNGIGIKDQFQEKVFKLFARLHPDTQYKGTGLGLAFAHKIIQKNGGQIWFESIPFKGTTFFFTLPILKEE